MFANCLQFVLPLGIPGARKLHITLTEHRLNWIGYVFGTHCEVHKLDSSLIHLVYGQE